MIIFESEVQKWSNNINTILNTGFQNCYPNIDNHVQMKGYLRTFSRTTMERLTKIGLRSGSFSYNLSCHSENVFIFYQIL